VVAIGTRAVAFAIVLILCVLSSWLLSWFLSERGC
jgi:hypothetical protein